MSNKLNEWTEQFNPFNSMKVLVWREELEAMAKGDIPVPVCVTIDPTNICNINCSWCIWKSYRQAALEEIPTKILLDIPKFLKDWGVKSVCIGGGGEPFCHKATAMLIRVLDHFGIPVGVITNGLALTTATNREAVKDICQWIGFSIDAATRKTYAKIKGVDAFQKVISNIKWLATHQKAKHLPRIGMKFLITNDSYKEVYEFVKLAKDTGAADVHFRPVYIPGYTWEPDVKTVVAEQVEKARQTFEDEDFHIFGITHKFDPEWKRAIRFKKCRATPINAYFLANGTLALCCDWRDNKELNLGPFYPFENVLKKWGSAEHKAMLAKIKPQECPRCTQCVTNEIIEHAIIEDAMCYRFV